MVVKFRASLIGGQSVVRQCEMKQFLVESFLVGLAGSAGALCRLVVGRNVQRLFQTAFPVGTLVVNVSGSLLLGWFLAYAQRRGMVSDAVRSGVAIGFVGAYTTFSTLMHDVDGEWRGGHFGRGTMNLVLSLLLGLAAVRIGTMMGSRN